MELYIGFNSYANKSYYIILMHHCCRCSNACNL